jgi:hypothetical protein
LTGARRLLAAAACAAAVLATRLPFVGGALDDVDAVNFALATRDFDPSLHQPHPPGYPVYVFAAQAATFGVADAGVGRALALLSALAQAALPLPLFALFTRLGARPAVAAAATALTLLNPVVWINGVRPMSDSVGLLAVVAAQGMALRAAASGRGLVAASIAAGLAAGVRVQALALTLPAWTVALARAGGRRRLIAAAALVAVIAAWAIPTLLESGGPGAFWAAFAGTASDASTEPLVSGWTPNRALRAAGDVFLRPWGERWLGTAMAGLGIAGVASALGGALSLRLAAIVFLPYLAAHALFQQTYTIRYAMPYVPLLALLAAAGMDALAGIAARVARGPAFAALAAAASAASAAIALPALGAYAAAEPPALAAMQAVRRIAHVPGRYALAGHYMFRRYFDVAGTSAAAAIPPRPRREVEDLQAFWRDGGARPLLFVGEPRRTDLESIDPAARTVRGRWAWPRAASRLLAGERPEAAELIEIAPPAWFAGPGWGLSLELARASGAMDAERTAWVKPAPAEALLLLAGEPTDPAAAEFRCALSVGGREIEARPCHAAWMGAYAVPPGAPGAYLPVVFRTSREGAPAEAPFALRALAYGPPAAALVVHGPGWHYPETTRDGRVFRWASRAARSLVHVPPAGRRLVVEGEVPRRHVPLPVSVEVASGGESRAMATSGRFRLELDLPPGPPREVELRADRDFVPDRAQRNRDFRRLAVRVDYFEVTAR